MLSKADSKKCAALSTADNIKLNLYYLPLQIAWITNLYKASVPYYTHASLYNVVRNNGAMSKISENIMQEDKARTINQSNSYEPAKNLTLYQTLYQTTI